MGGDEDDSSQEKIPKLRYIETLMHGHYSTSRLRRFAATLSKKDKDSKGKETTKSFWSRLRSPTGEDVVFLTLLGLSVAVISFLIDVFCDVCLEAHRWLYRATSFSLGVQFLVFVTFPIIFICFSTGFTHFLSPAAFGSGIPEIKTMLTGVKLKECLTFSTFVSKVIGLSFSLASGMPLGKLGPFVHVGSATSSLLAKLFPSKAKLKSFHSSILTAGAAVGVSCIFGTPIGGIMYSVEATATNYATENFWRGLYASMCGAITLGFFKSLARNHGTILPFFKSDFNNPVPYDVLEIIIFIFLGLLCGLLGALFVYSHQSIVIFIRSRKKLSAFLQRTRFLYPALVTLIVFSFLFPAGLGQYMAGELTLREAVFNMFDNRTWTTAEATTEEELRYLSVWKGPLNNPILTVFLFFVMRFWMCAVATTMPVPCGIFIPTFTLGAAFGRFFGECMAFYFPEGLRGVVISPGAYSIIGAATLSGAMSHTVSPAVIAFEMTGYLGHILPCVIGVCVAGAVANLLRPSLYDAIIQIKNLPFLPPVINPHETNAYEVTADDMVDKGVECIYFSDTLEELLDKVTSSIVEEYPVLNNKDEKMFMGSIKTSELKRLIIDEAKDDDNENAQIDSQPTRKISLGNLLGRILPERKYSTVSNNLHAINDAENPNIEREPSSPVKMRRVSRFSITRTEDEDIKKIKQLRFKRDSEQLSQVSCWSQRKLNQLNLNNYVDFAAFHISNSLSLYKIHWVFSYLSIHQVFVIDKGAFVGILKLPAVLKAISDPIEPKPYFKQELERLLKFQ